MDEMIRHDANQERNHRLRHQLREVLSQLHQQLLPEDEAVVAAFLETDDHVTAEELEHRLGDRNLSPSQIRRVMHTLCELGIAQHLHLDDTAIYEHRHLDHHHDHLVCVRCGRILEFLSPEIEHRQNQLCRDFEFTPLMHKLEIRGVCADCARHTPVTRSLDACLRGETVRVSEIHGGRGLRRRLVELGITRGTPLTLLGTAGPIVVEVRGARIALGRHQAERVIVERTEPREEETRTLP